MNGSRPWQGPSDLLELYGIDPAKPGALSFCWLVLYGATAAELLAPDSLDDIARALMRGDRLSPVVWWGRIKRTLRPILEADRETLAALGLEPATMTGRGLAAAVVNVLHSDPAWLPPPLLIQMYLDTVRR